MSFSNFELALLANRHSIKTWIESLGKVEGEKAVPAGARACIASETVDRIQESLLNFRSIKVFRIAPQVQFMVPPQNEKLNRFEYVGERPYILSNSSGGRTILMSSDSMLYFPERKQLYVHCSNAVWKVISQPEAASSHSLEMIACCVS